MDNYPPAKHLSAGVFKWLRHGKQIRFLTKKEKQNDRAAILLFYTTQKK